MTEDKPHKIEMMVLLIAIAVLGAGIYFFGPSITGFAVKEAGYSKDLNVVVTSNGNYTLELDGIGELKSLKLDGSVTSYGKARVYIENNGGKYLIFDSTRLEEDEKTSSNESNLITGFAINEDKEKKDKNNKPVWIGPKEFAINGTAELHLSEYFADEDGDELAYSVSEAENLDVSIDGSVAAIESLIENNFNATITFIASDGIDSKSHTVKLVVMAEKIINNAALQINETNETINQTPTSNETINQTDLTASKTIAINLSYNSGTIYDANDNGEESVNGAVDLSVADTKFSWDADDSKLCTRWEIYNAEEAVLATFCSGNADCCAFLGLLPENQNWNEAYYSTYGKDGAGHGNIVSAQVIYYDVNLSIDSLKSEIYNSEWGNLSVKFFEEELVFFGECLETCSLTGLNKSRYTLIFEMEDDAVLRIDSVKYSLQADAENTAPKLLQNISTINVSKNKNATINLSRYFYDEDGDRLHYNYYAADNITVLFDGDAATVIPDKGAEGIRYTYFTAADSDLEAASNVFAVSIAEDQKIDFFEIRDKDDRKLAVFDSLGNLAIKGVLVHDKPAADENDFIVQSPSGSLSMVITNPEGNLLLRSSLIQNQGYLSPTPDSFAIQDSTGATAAYVNSTGSLFLAGILSENTLFS